jgi:hypothetical protein
LATRHFLLEEIAVVTGGVDIGEAFARLPFDHLLFKDRAERDELKRMHLTHRLESMDKVFDTTDLPFLESYRSERAPRL